MSNAQILNQRALLDEHLIDEFSKELLDEAIRILGDQSYKYRLHIFATLVRETITHTLHELAPTAAVEACPWFKQAEDTHGPTREQRLRYAMQGGMTDDFVDGLPTDLEDERRDLLKAFSSLNKHTHLRPGRLVEDQTEMDRYAQDTFKALLDFLLAARTFRTTLSDYLEGAVAESLTHHTFEKHLDELAEISGGYEVNGVWPDNLVVEAIGPTEIVMKVESEVDVTLHYGGRGDSTSMNDSYPFTATILVRVDDLSHIDVRSFEIDNSSFFGPIEDSPEEE
ncbi:hypothetical protein sos41_31380 [Alphaproteobacteria bacterium SO-S41]|nr:hypothetical protein sos41_31380 [Alphaproteobacteria bacterium SO-S41]